MTKLIPPRVQPLSIPVSALLPKMYRWYVDNPKSRAKEDLGREVVGKYNLQLKFFNAEKGTDYRPITTIHLYYWLRSNPNERMRTPFLDEVLILASVSGFDTTSEALSNYLGWVLDSFTPSQLILDTL